MSPELRKPPPRVTSSAISIMRDPTLHRSQGPQPACHRLHEEVSADYNAAIYAASAAKVEQRRRGFIRKWRLKCKAVANSLEEARDRHSPSPSCRAANGVGWGVLSGVEGSGETTTTRSRPS